MNKDRVKGMIDGVAGSAKRKAGEWTNNPKLQAKGTVQQAKGKVENALGKAKDAIRDTMDHTEVRLDTSMTVQTKDSAADADCGRSE